nr:MAG: replication initiator protein [Microvirus sp.]
MPCFKPLQGYFSVDPDSGKKKFVGCPIMFDHWKRGYSSLDNRRKSLPCGRCIGCRLDRSRGWAMRCIHEASLHESNCFITLTYAPEFLPEGGTLVKKHFQDFMKRLRKKFGSGIRFFHCGEYGDLYKRPHYHAIIFNLDFDDKVLYKIENGCRLYTSDNLHSLWPYGLCTVGAVTFESAAYVARYIMKKVTGDMAEAHYGGRLPEYTTMSRRPGIAFDWFKKFKSDVYPSDQVIVRGFPCKPPRYYDTLFELEDPLLFQSLKEKRSVVTEKRLRENGFSRLAVRERVKSLCVSRLVRGLENVI